MDMLGAMVMLIGGLFGTLVGFYCVLCFIQWISDVVDEQRWRYWFK